MANPNDPPLDEIQWHSPQLVANMGGLHSNTVLFYFAESPFFERTSNNAVILSQAMNNMNMYHYIQTREAFEARLKAMSGLEFMVGEEPAESGPGMGTGVWVIRKQTRRKRYQEEDEVTVHSSYFVVGENIYMAPSLSDILASRLMTITSSLAKAFPAAESARKWRPSTGHTYQLSASTAKSATAATSNKAPGSKEDTPMPDAMPVAATASKPLPSTTHVSSAREDESSLERRAEEAFMVHMRYGGDYIDENPITGRPGEFHLSSTGRKPQQPIKLSSSSQKPGLAGANGMNGPAGIKVDTKVVDADSKKDSAKEKTPRSAGPGKQKRRKSKAGVISAASTPAASSAL